MHMYVIARGIDKELRQWMNDVGAMFLPIQYAKGKHGKVRVAIRPIQLFEIVFPEEQEEFMSAAIQDNTGSNRKKNFLFNPFCTLLRKAMRLSECKNVQANGAIINPYVAIAKVGTKKDERNEDGIELL